MAYFQGHIKLFMMFLLMLVFVERLAMAAARNSDSLVDLFSSDRDEMESWAGYGEDKLSTVVIGGKIVCHGHGGGDVNTASHPVSGARVAIVCGSSPKKKKLWAKTSTDVSGNFLIDLPSHLHSIPNLEKICHIKLLRLPKTTLCCFGRKQNPIKLTSNGGGIRSYTTHTIHMMPHNHT